jgi:hypothetical protein
MLLARFVGDTTADKMLSQLEAQGDWSQSDFRNLPSERIGLRTEATFYEALRSVSIGASQRGRDLLRRTVSLGVTSYIEYSIAEFLLTTEP